jgi:hypothetical protein
MPDHTSGGRRRQLADRIGAAATQIPGVVRVEPTLHNTLIRLGQTYQPVGRSDSSRSETPATDGIDVRLHDEWTGASARADVRIDITVSSARPAVTTAADLARRIDEILTDSGLFPGTIGVNILAIT